MRAALLLVLLLASAGCGRSADAWTAEGDALLRANKLSEAERAYNRALARDPHHAPAAYGNGWALYASGFEDLRPAARQLFQRAIDYDPEFFGGYRGKGVMLLEEGQLLVAEKLLRQAWEKAPDEPATLESLGQLYLGSGRTEDAETLFRAAVAASPGRGELWRFVADALAARGDLDGARDALLVGMGSSVSGVRGLVLLQEGQAGLEIRLAEELARASLGPDDERLDDALQALDRADTVLKDARQQGVFDLELSELARRAASVRLVVERSRVPREGAGGARSEP
jgi:predicted Zn-dependent protease